MIVIKRDMQLLRRVAFSASEAKAAIQYPTFNYAKDIPSDFKRTHWNLFHAINSAIDIALQTDHTYTLPNPAPRCSEKM